MFFFFLLANNMAKTWFPSQLMRGKRIIFGLLTWSCALKGRLQKIDVDTVGCSNTNLYLNWKKLILFVVFLVFQGILFQFCLNVTYWKFYAVEIQTKVSISIIKDLGRHLITKYRVIILKNKWSNKIKSDVIKITKQIYSLLPFSHYISLSLIPTSTRPCNELFHLYVRGRTKPYP